MHLPYSQRCLLFVFIASMLGLTAHFGYVRTRQILNGFTWSQDLHPVNDHCVRCEVTAGSPESTAATTITWLLDEGTFVKKGDTIARLDDSDLRRRLLLQQREVTGMRMLLELTADNVERKAVQERLGKACARQESLESDIRRCCVEAPYDGKLYYFMPDACFSGYANNVRMVSENETVHERQKLFWIDASEPVSVVSVNIPERFMGKVYPGQFVWLFKHSRIVGRGKVTFIASEPARPDYFVRDTSRYEVHVELTERAAELRPFSYAEFQFVGK